MSLGTESLESRRLLASSLSGGTLTLTGTAAANAFILTRNGTDIIVSENGGAGKRYASASVTLIGADLGDGSDYLDISDAVTQPVSAIGGAGDDTLLTGGGNDTIDGGAGNDSIDGGGGNDTVTYATRTLPVTANLQVNDPQYYPARPLLTGGGGETGEHDTFISIETIDGGSGDDALSIGTGSSGFLLNEGDLLLLRINGGAGRDALTIGAGYLGGEPTRFPQEIADGGIGDDDLYFPVTTFASTTVIGGEGDDYFHNEDDSFAHIDAGPGIDTLDMRTIGVATSYTMPEGLENLNVSGLSLTQVDGNDLDNRISGFISRVNALGGNDTVVLHYDDETVDGGAGMDFIQAPSALTAVATVSSAGTITAALTMSGYQTSTTNVEIFTGSTEDDTFELHSPANAFTGTNRPVVIFDGNSGNDTFNLFGLLATNTTVAAIQIDGGPGSDKVIFRDAALTTPATYFIGDYNNPSSPATLTDLSRTTPNGAKGDVEIRGLSAVDFASTTFNDTISVNTTLLTKLVINSGDGIDTLSVNQTLGSIDLNFISGAGDDALNIRTAGPEIGTAVVRLYQSETLGSIDIAGGGVLVVAPTPNESSVIRTRTLTIDPGGKLDLTNNPLIVDYAGTSPATTIASLLRTGRNSDWMGNGIISSTAAAATGTTLGMATSADLFPTFPATFAGQPVDNTAVLVRYTRVGDANLDRTVNFADLVRLSQNYGQTGRIYSQGDFNFDGKVDFADLTLLAQNYNTAIAAPVLLTRASDQSRPAGKAKP